MKTSFFRTLSKAVLAAGLLCAGIAHGQTLLSATLTAGVSRLSENPLLAYALTINNPNAAAVTVRLYDNDSASSTNVVRVGYSTYSYARATNSTVITNVFGNLQTNSFIYLNRTETVTGAVTNEATLVYPPITIPAASTVNVDFGDSPIAVGRGLNALTLNSNVTAFLTYLPLP